MPYLTAMHRESEVLRRVSEGDERAFAALFNHYHQRLGMHIYRITRSEELAAEVVQDVFLKIWLNKELLAEVNNFPVYLYVISKNAALNCLKKAASESARIVDVDLHSEHFPVADTIEEDHRYLLIDEAIDLLPPQQKQVYLLSRHQRLSYAEIAAQMNISRETVKKYLQIATESISSHIRNKLIISFLLAAHYFFSK
ncbi:RNA polymerase sigma factor [Dyadobacter sp. Leaf189]|uniref:RNA polymerase sigma factor n=1 Tax=Dyadobacter sp. Leaf189 TaxID=1736295 RepID=UPI0006FD6EB3|nr:sigma-70 family RNA polymerase sigma factor [Dyadobacter sp. Leaf189]KQS27783.1 RNA polymerase subunit sigma-24 [Dyadobacter sp. Leaf189]